MDSQTFRGVREGPIGWRIVVVAVASVVAVVMLTALAVALAPPPPPGSVLIGTTWRWTGALTGPGDVPRVVPDPAKYTIEFMSDWTFRGTADCNAVSGTYVVILPGRTGLSSNGLRLELGPTSLASCGPDSLSGPYLEGLRSSVRYQISDSRLSISTSAPGMLVFEAAGPAASAPGGG
jgi:hypothetical protein